MRPNVVYKTIWAAATDPLGRPMALLIYQNRTWEYIPHAGFTETGYASHLR